MDKKIIIGFVIGIIILLGGIVFFTARSTSSGPDYSEFAQCLKDKGAIFYGAFWCPHCQATKKMFGAGASKLPYVECSTPDGNGQVQICIEKGIKQYPTWVFADGSQLTGELTFAQLSSKTGCAVPTAPGTSDTSADATASNVANSSNATNSSSSSDASTSSVSASSSLDIIVQ